MNYLVFDVESIGLRGEHWSVGYVVIAADGTELEAGQFSCLPILARGEADGRVWVKKNCPIPQRGFNCSNPDEVVKRFVEMWKRLGRKCWLVADCPYPVEMRFLETCIKQCGEGLPAAYPLIDVASVRFAAGLDPLGIAERQADELPVHDALADARQSARLLMEVIA